MTYKKLSTMNENDYNTDPYNLRSYFVENFIPLNNSEKSKVSNTINNPPKIKNRFNIDENAINDEHIQSQQIYQMQHQMQHQMQQEIEDPSD